MSEHTDPPRAISFTRFEILVQTAAAVASRSSRNDKITLIAALLGRLTSDEAASAASFMSGEIRQGALGVGRALLNGLNGVTPSPQARLTIGEVDGFFERLRALGGAGSQQQRRLLLEQLFGQATRDEQRFLARLLVGELRQGAVIGVVMEAVAQAAALSPTLVRRALMLCGETERVTRVAFERGEPGLRAIGLELFRPIRPMLAHPADSLDHALSAFAHPHLEVKLDGARVQVHKLGRDVRVFSRQGHDVTAAVPEVPELVAGLGVHDLVLDGEVLAMRADGRPYPFQTSMRRFGRRVDVESLRAELSMTPFFFDCMQCDGELLIDAPASERFARLEEVVPERFQVPRIVPADAEQAHDFLARTLAAGHEGVMVKDPSAPYEAGVRCRHWLKIKQSETLDLVVLAAEWGSGRRSGWLSNLHLGARDPSGGFVMLGKTFKGLTDEMLVWQTARLSALRVSEAGGLVTVRPELVVEVAFNEIQRSPQYPAGLALRFARVKQHRPDKRAEEADEIARVWMLFERQLAYLP
ncbi:ATP-dependent DNA ligase [Thiocapsa imhoffii]|uniref:Probable DNA ligase n=1 Tax=Thiocapsa imhoffii TaxID=382777 RepID=A0A9X0WG59_9GAMM|nr:ATP-dependent DNA ligase [Thiocapsa imhoffii]MBK1643567.1 ATP-dependent DNA ligase [Thiocapsa imhoffii]